MELVEKIERTIRSEHMFEHGARILCAVSGGADSTAMLFALCALAPSLGLSLEVAHVNHGLRGPESDFDEAFVRTLCRRLQLPLYVRQVNVAECAKRTKQGIEACARDARYSFFKELMQETGIKILATAHNARDNLETALFHLTRGTGVAGIAGIPAVRRENDYTIIRPLIRVSREEIECYLKEIHEPYVTDSSNESERYTRNVIRRHVLPELERLNPSLYETAAETQRRLRQDADFIDLAVQDAYQALVVDGACDTHALSALHPAVFGRLIARLYQEIAPDGPQFTSANCEEVNALIHSRNPSAHAVLPAGVIVRREYGKIRFTRFSSPQKLITRTLEIGKTTLFREAGIEISCNITPRLSQNFRFIHKFYFDSARIYGILSVRARQEGDYIHLAGHLYGKSLKKAMVDAKIPRFRRDLVPVICDERGILAVDGLGVARRAAVTAETKELLMIQISDIHGGYINDDGIQ